MEFLNLRSFFILRLLARRVGLALGLFYLSSGGRGGRVRRVPAGLLLLISIINRYLGCRAPLSTNSPLLATLVHSRKSQFPRPASSRSQKVSEWPPSPSSPEDHLQSAAELLDVDGPEPSLSK